MLNGVGQGKEIHNYMIRTGFDANVLVVNSVIDMDAKAYLFFFIPYLKSLPRKKDWTPTWMICFRTVTRKLSLMVRLKTIPMAVESTSSLTKILNFLFCGMEEKDLDAKRRPWLSLGISLSVSSLTFSPFQYLGIPK